MNCLWMSYEKKNLILPEGEFFSRAHKTTQNTQDQLSVKELNYMPSFMFLAQYTLGKLCEMRSNYTPSLTINCGKRG